MKVLVVAGARPNFMKVAPILAELRQHPGEFSPFLVHTGQHYDYRMSDVFFTDLDLPPPDSFLQARGETAAAQTADIMLRFEPVLQQEKPDLVVVVGDVTSTPACALVAAKREVPVAHVEAGLRSGDRRMPEELNRIVTDGLSDLLFTYSEDADANLLAEGVPAAAVHRVGNVMIDTLLRCRRRSASSGVLERLGVVPKGYGLVTLHRPSNVDEPEALRGILRAFGRIQEQIPLLFLVHPRTRGCLQRFGLDPLLASMPGLRLLEPVGYLDMLRLQEEARLVLTDSGGIQEETTVLGVPCLTIRENTERPITLTQGTNVLVGCSPERIVEEALHVLEGGGRAGRVPPLWDGQSARRLVEVLRQGIRRR
ncbi:MAG: UDP-N-acetylglucosamine 2-epimerase (non-hydrolyzing) [Candidatus Latescibacterota bacterium]